jgi:hypothetical protein
MSLSRIRVALASAVGLALVILSADCGGGAGSPLGPGGISLTISPATISIPFGNPQQFTASVTGTSNTAVTWSVEGINGGSTDVGTITTMGLYTAPVVASSAPPVTGQTVLLNAGPPPVSSINIAVPPLPSKTSVTIRATSQVDTTKSASAKVTLTPLSFIAAGIGTRAGVTGVEVSRGSTGSTVNLFLVGKGFVLGTFYAISGPNGVTVTQPTGADFGQTTDGLPAVNITISVSPSAALGPRNIIVNDPAGELTVFVGGLLVTL